MTNPAVRPPRSSRAHARRARAHARRALAPAACALAAAALWAAPALATPAPPQQASVDLPGAASPGAAQPSQGKAPAHLAPSPEADAEAEEKRLRIERATALHDEAQELYQHGRYRAAIAKLEAAVALDPEGKELIYNLAVIHERLGEIERAEGYYLRYLEMETLPKEREQVAAVLKRLKGAKRELASARQQQAAPPAPAGASTALPMLPRVSLLPRRSVVVASPRPSTPWLLVSGGVAAGSLVVGGVFAALAVARDPGPDARTGDGISVADLQADASAAHRCAVAADVALLVAGLSGITALYLYLSPRVPAVHPRASRPALADRAAPPPGHGDGLPSRGARAGEAATAVGLSLGADGARLQVRF
ncbi:tetratricopeptide repeat protein [Sorangium sp. So ce1024]|uniref:tetratricopeptide repeat protein n=1 Tax=unclassified Sorangium TaxID=2621164 RepID=UPI003EFCE1E0